MLQKLADRALKKCPACGKPALQRLVSAPAFRLKGGGWYETDFKSDAEKKRNLVETSSGESSEGGGDKDKPGEKSEPKAETAKEGVPAKDAKDSPKPVKAKPVPKKAKPRTQSART